MRISDWSSDVCSSDLGELLTIESVTVPGKGQIKTTGKLGEVMTESVQAAFSYVKARSPGYGIRPSIYNRKDIHIHLPEGAVPKDGPSAGIGMVTSIVSTLTRSEEHTSELQSLMRISYAVFCLTKKTSTKINSTIQQKHRRQSTLS